MKKRAQDRQFQCPFCLEGELGWPEEFSQVWMTGESLEKMPVAMEVAFFALPEGNPTQKPLRLCHSCGVGLMQKAWAAMVKAAKESLR